ncbi:hypothetical protein, partial [Atlantibacter subterraneus]|uniref:hypothetical protein n=1 Tax=Atlantibacter subterraneus TaxID=255519 RepID=UPI003B02E48E
LGRGVAQLFTRGMGATRLGSAFRPAVAGAGYLHQYATQRDERARYSEKTAWGGVD